MQVLDDLMTAAAWCLPLHDGGRSPCLAQTKIEAWLVEPTDASSKIEQHHNKAQQFDRLHLVAHSEGHQDINSHGWGRDGHMGAEVLQTELGGLSSCLTTAKAGSILEEQPSANICDG